MISFFVRTFIYIKKSNINRRLKVQFLYHLFFIIYKTQVHFEFESLKFMRLAAKYSSKWEFFG